MTRCKKSKNYNLIGSMETNRLTVGLAPGLSLGLQLDNIRFGIGLCLIFGVCIGAISWGSNDRDENSTEV